MIGAAASIGPRAERTLAQHAAGHVQARFARSVHLLFGDDIVCMVAPDLGNGPLNVVVPGLCADDACGFVAGALIACDGTQIHWADGKKLAWRCAARWQPALPAQPDRQQAYVLLKNILHEMAPPPESFFAWAKNMDSAQGLLMQAAAMRIDALQRWLEQPDGAPPILPLIGLGHGLTPSGDDLIGGLALALRWLGMDSTLLALTDSILKIPAGRTTSLSMNFLRAACEGMAHESIHALISRLSSLDEKDVRQALTQISRIGHSSGWDALAGIWLAMDVAVNSIAMKRVAA